MQKISLLLLIIVDRFFDHRDDLIVRKVFPAISTAFSNRRDAYAYFSNSGGLLIIIRVTDKIGRTRSEAGVRFVNHENDYEQNLTTRSPVTN